MRNLIRITAIALTCMSLCIMPVDAADRGRRQEHNHSQEQKQHKQHDHRPSGGSHKGNNHRPQQPHRPQHNPRPAQPPRPQHNRRQAQPSRAHHNVRHGAPHRPHFYAPRPHWRPAPPPPAWRPRRAWHPIRSILGITLGSAINISINALLSNGYNVIGYDTDAVYLTNVPMLNMSWPVANLYYNNGGGLYGSEFIYATDAYNISRYNNVYNQLCMSYGNPYSVQNLGGGGCSATWWGDNGQYITLQFQQNRAYDGALRFFTTLRFG